MKYFLLPPVGHTRLWPSLSNRMKLINDSLSKVIFPSLWNPGRRTSEEHYKTWHFFFNSVKSTNTSGAPDPPCDVTSQVNYWLGVCGCPEPEARDKDFICAEQEIRAEAQERLCADSKRWRYGGAVMDNVNDRVLMSTVCIIVAVVYCAGHKRHRYKIWANDHHWRIVKLLLYLLKF